MTPHTHRGEPSATPGGRRRGWTLFMELELPIDIPGVPWARQYTSSTHNQSNPINTNNLINQQLSVKPTPIALINLINAIRDALSRLQRRFESGRGCWVQTGVSTPTVLTLSDDSLEHGRQKAPVVFVCRRSRGTVVLVPDHLIPRDDIASIDCDPRPEHPLRPTIPLT